MDVEVTTYVLEPHHLCGRYEVPDITQGPTPLSMPVISQGIGWDFYWGFGKIIKGLS